MQRRRGSVLLLLTTTAVLTGCPADIEVGIEDGSTLESLTFTISRGSSDRPTAVRMLLVESCASIYSDGGDVYWRVESAERPAELRRLSYGDVPSGYRVSSVARDLKRNECYVVTYGGNDELYFVADASGSLSVVTQEEARELASS